MSLDRTQWIRYSRHLLMPEVGEEGQARLRGGSVLLVGAGGLGAPAALYLAAAGVGRLGLADYDRVELSNLQRQVLYGTSDIGQPKLMAARRRVADLNPDVEIVAHADRLVAANVMDALAGYDVVVDGSDNFPTRYLVNDACTRLGTPLVYGSIFRMEGQASVFWAGRGPCYRCLFPEPPPAELAPNCAEAGVLGVLPGIIGAIQAAEAMKLLMGTGTTLLGRLLLFDASEMRFRELSLRRDPQCPGCSEEGRRRPLEDLPEVCAPPARTADANRMTSPAAVEDAAIDAEALRALRERALALRLVDVRTPAEWEICHLEGAQLVPLDRLAAEAEDWDRGASIVLSCHVGARSARGAALLRRMGFRNVRHLAGGIRAWAESVDPALPRY